MDNNLQTIALAAFVNHSIQSFMVESPFEVSDNLFADIAEMHAGFMDTWPTTLLGLVRDVLADLTELDFVDASLADCLDSIAELV
jgi:hypothetical protein